MEILIGLGVLFLSLVFKQSHKSLGEKFKSENQGLENLDRNIINKVEF